MPFLMTRSTRANIYARSNKESGKLEFVGSWNGTTFNIRNVNIYPKRRKSNLFGKNLKASSFENRPFTYIVDTVDGDSTYDGSDVSFGSKISF